MAFLYIIAVIFLLSHHLKAKNLGNCLDLLIWKFCRASLIQTTAWIRKNGTPSVQREHPKGLHSTTEERGVIKGRPTSDLNKWTHALHKTNRLLTAPYLPATTAQNIFILTAGMNGNEKSKPFSGPPSYIYHSIKGLISWISKRCHLHVQFIGPSKCGIEYIYIYDSTYQQISRIR